MKDCRLMFMEMTVLVVLLLLGAGLMMMGWLDRPVHIVVIV